MGSKTHEMRADWILPTVVESTQAEGKSPKAISTLPAVEITRISKRGDIYTPMRMEEITHTATVGVYPPGSAEGSDWWEMATRDDHHARPDDVGIWQRAMWGSFAPTQMDVIPELWEKAIMEADPLMWGEWTTNFVEWFEGVFPQGFFPADRGE